MKKLMITLAAVCAISTSAIASDSIIPVKASAETGIKIKIPGQTFSPETSVETGIKIKIPGQTFSPETSTSTNYQPCKNFPYC